MENHRHLRAVFENSLDAILLEEKLSGSEALLAETQSLAHIGSWNWDIASDTVVWSDEHYRIFGLPPQSTPMTYARFMHQVHPEDQAVVQKHVDKAFRDHEPYECRFRVTHGDGTVRTVQSLAQTVFDASGKPLRMFGTAQDITELRQAEERTRESEERLQLAIYAADLGVFEHDHRTDALYWSPVMRDILGWGADDPVTMPHFIELIHPEDRAEKVVAIQQAHDPAGDGAYSVEHRIVQRDGTVRWVRACSRTYFEGEAAARRPVRTIGTMADITERRQREIELRHHREQAEEVRNHLAAIVESAADAIIGETLDGTITSWNAGAERLFGYSAQDAIGKNIALIIPAERQEEESQFMARITRGESVDNHETERLHKSGRRVDVALSISPVRDSAGSVIGCAKIIQDVTTRKRLEKEVLEIANREQRIIGQVLHDATGQQLTALSLLAEALVKSLERRTTPLPCQETVIAGKLALGLRQVLSQIRGIARGLVPVEVDSQGLLAALGELAARISESSGVNCTLNCGTNPAEIDDNLTATHLFHIAQEAVTNALKHGKPTHITLALVEDDQAVTLLIQDNGVGFPAGPVVGEGIGLKIMQYRAGLIHGRLTVGPLHDDKGTQAGTAVTCVLFKGAIHEQKHD